MEQFAVNEKNNKFVLPMCDFFGKSFDNAEALDKRYVFVLVGKGSGIAKIDDNAISYIAPCIFCVSEKEHIVIPESEKNEIRALFFHPSIINNTLDFEKVRSITIEDGLTIYQDREMLNLFLQRENNFFGKFDLGPFTLRRIMSLLDSFHRQVTEQSMENWPCRSRSYIMALVFFLDNIYEVGGFSKEKTLSDLSEKIYPILEYIYHNYDKKITVDEITKKFFLSRATLSKLFQENVGDTFLSYLNKLRISMASTILRDTMLPINEIMNRVGFNDTVHFLRTFKKYTGYTPSQYREKFTWM